MVKVDSKGTYAKSNASSLACRSLDEARIDLELTGDHGEHGGVKPHMAECQHLDWIAYGKSSGSRTKRRLDLSYLGWPCLWNYVINVACPSHFLVALSSLHPPILLFFLTLLQLGMI